MHNYPNINSSAGVKCGQPGALKPQIHLFWLTFTLLAGQMLVVVEQSGSDLEGQHRVITEQGQCNRGRQCSAESTATNLHTFALAQE